MDSFATGRELWVTDGTEGGTRRVFDPRPGPDDFVSTKALASLGDKVFFFANDGVHGSEIWASDGTADGTRMLRDIRDGAQGSELDLLSPGQAQPIVATDEWVWFVADDGIHGDELWKPDGTGKGTAMVRDIHSRRSGSRISAIHPLPSGRHVLVAASDGQHGTELWISDGTQHGTRLVEDIALGPESGALGGAMVTAGPFVYFHGWDAEAGGELWALPLRPDWTRRATVDPGGSARVMLSARP